MWWQSERDVGPRIAFDLKEHEPSFHPEYLQFFYRADAQQALDRAPAGRALVDPAGEFCGHLIDPLPVYLLVEPHQADVFLVVLQKQRLRDATAFPSITKRMPETCGSSVPAWPTWQPSIFPTHAATSWLEGPRGLSITTMPAPVPERHGSRGLFLFLCCGRCHRTIRVFPRYSLSAASVPSSEPSPTISGNVPPHRIASAVTSPMAITSSPLRGVQTAFL